jgi:small-conductance mechanosensitive channel
MTDLPAVWNGLLAFIDTFRVPLTILLTVAIAVVARLVLLATNRRVVRNIIDRYHKNTSGGEADEGSPVVATRLVQRTRTIGTVLDNIVTWAIVGIASIIVLQELGVGVTAIIASAGIVGAALGFGAQNVVKDMLNGLFMVFEDQLGVGDVVDLGPASGIVENVGVRVTTLRDVNGTVWYVRNGEIMRVGNLSQGWARVVLDLAIPYEADVDEVQRILLQAATTMAESEQWRTKVLEAPAIWGLQSISADALVVRLVMKTVTSARDDAARALRREIKLALDAAGVQLPPVNSVVVNAQIIADSK